MEEYNDSYDMYWKLLVISMVYQGETIFKASDYVRTNRKTGERWVKNYNENGLEGLYSIFEHANDLIWKMKADYQTTKEKYTIKKEQI